jgi:tetratricopeptide (TPR) repeat protein
LISARVKLLSPTALLERLHGRLLLQSDGLCDLEPRHRTLNAAIEWSYQLLNVEEQTLFRRLGVFVGGWTLEAAGTICLENLTLNVLEGLASLLDKSLVKQATGSAGEPRFIMLETIHEYALEKSVASGELEMLRRHHATYFLALAEAAQPALTDAQQGQWLDRLELEHPNFRAALAWSHTETGRDNELRLASALAGFWQQRGHLSEGSSWLADALVQPEVDDSSGSPTVARQTLRARVLALPGTFGLFQNDLEAAQSHYEESLALSRELGDRARIGDVLGGLGMVTEMRGDHQQAVILLEENLALWRELGNRSDIAYALFFLGQPAYTQGQRQRASVLFEESLSLFREAKDSFGIASVLFRLAMLGIDRGEYEQAGAYLVESVTRLHELGERWQIINTLEVFACLAAVEGQQGEHPQFRLLRSARLFGAPAYP